MYWNHSNPHPKTRLFEGAWSETFVAPDDDTDDEWPVGVLRHGRTERLLIVARQSKCWIFSWIISMRGHFINWLRVFFNVPPKEFFLKCSRIINQDKQSSTSHPLWRPCTFSVLWLLASLATAWWVCRAAQGLRGLQELTMVQSAAAVWGTLAMPLGMPQQKTSATAVRRGQICPNGFHRQSGSLVCGRLVETYQLTSRTVLVVSVKIVVPSKAAYTAVLKVHVRLEWSMVKLARRMIGPSQKTAKVHKSSIP